MDIVHSLYCSSVATRITKYRLKIILNYALKLQIIFFAWPVLVLYMYLHRVYYLLMYLISPSPPKKKHQKNPPKYQYYCQKIDLIVDKILSIWSCTLLLSIWSCTLHASSHFQQKLQELLNFFRLSATLVMLVAINCQLD